MQFAVKLGQVSGWRSRLRWNTTQLGHLFFPLSSILSLSFCFCFPILLYKLSLQLPHYSQGVRDVIVSLGEEDSRRPKDYWVEKPKGPPIPARDQRFDTMTRKGMQRAASVRWFKEVEKKKGAGQSGSGFANWFHGVITRKVGEGAIGLFFFLFFLSLDFFFAHGPFLYFDFVPLIYLFPLHVPSPPPPPLSYPSP